MMQFAFQNSLSKLSAKMGDLLFLVNQELRWKPNKIDEKILSSEASYTDQQSSRKLKLYKNLYNRIDQKCFFI